MASCTPATSSHLIDESESGLISSGFVRGMNRSIPSRTTAISPMKIRGSQVSIQVWMPSQEMARRVVISSFFGQKAEKPYSWLSRRRISARAACPTSI